VRGKSEKGGVRKATEREPVTKNLPVTGKPPGNPSDNNTVLLSGELCPKEKKVPCRGPGAAKV